MIVAIWIIAICEVVRALQNLWQLWMSHSEVGARKNAYQEFIDSLKKDDAEWVRQMLVEFEKQNNEKNYW